MSDTIIMSDTKKKLFGLFRSRSVSEKKSRESPLNSEHISSHREDGRSSTPTRLGRSHSTHSHMRRRKKPRAAPRQVLTSWPPANIPPDGILSQGEAEEIIASGAPVFKGHRRAIPHASDEYYAFYATCEGNEGAGNDGAEPYNAAFTAMSFRLRGGSGSTLYPWETLEQPSLSFCYGYRPGTITLNHWVSLSGKPNPRIELRDPDVKPREVELSTILQRLIDLQGGFEDDDANLMYKNLYRNLLKDPDRYISPHKAMEKQIADLIIVLSRKEWIDFSRPENQVVAKFYASATYTDHRRYKAFFHQLLLSTELDLRINSKQHTDWAKGKLLSQLPPCIAWDLALARKWRECMSIEKFKTGGDPEQIRFYLKVKNAQVKALRKFARAMKWPNLATVDNVLKERDPHATPLEDRSSDTMSYFTGVILPGITLPYLVMNSLIDCDDDQGTSALAALTHMHPHSGFQYKSTTYWSSTCIVGKVLAPTCREICGWVGPARPAPDLARIQIARIRSRRPPRHPLPHLTASDMTSMSLRSDPLGPPSSTGYPVSEYHLPIPDPTDIVDTIRIEKLALKPIVPLPPPPSQSTSQSTSQPPSSQQAPGKNAIGKKPLTYDAAIQFAIWGRSWPLRLSYDTSFIAAQPCAGGPHPLFDDYVYHAVRADELLRLRGWGSNTPPPPPVPKHSSPPSPSSSPPSLNKIPDAGSSSSSTRIDNNNPAATNPEDPTHTKTEDEEERVLVVESFGVPDTEVLVRAWCSHWGIAALVTDVRWTCMACAIREAYAACLNVVILIDGYGQQGEADGREGQGDGISV